MPTFDWCGPGRGSDEHMKCPGRYDHQFGTHRIHGECSCTCHTRTAILAIESNTNRK